MSGHDQKQLDKIKKIVEAEEPITHEEAVYLLKLVEELECRVRGMRNEIEEIERKRSWEGFMQ